MKLTAIKRAVSLEHDWEPSFVAKLHNSEREAPAEQEPSRFESGRRVRADGLRSRNYAIAAEYGVSCHAQMRLYCRRKSRTSKNSFSCPRALGCRPSSRSSAGDRASYADRYSTPAAAVSSLMIVS